VSDGIARCSVCGEEIPRGMSAECNWCNGAYHLNQRNDTEAKDCGRVWIDEQYLALQFACDACLAGADVGSATPKPQAAQRPRRYRRRA
jgi:hypothetical protein